MTATQPILILEEPASLLSLCVSKVVTFIVRNLPLPTSDLFHDALNAFNLPREIRRILMQRFLEYIKSPSKFKLEIEMECDRCRRTFSINELFQYCYWTIANKGWDTIQTRITKVNFKEHKSARKRNAKHGEKQQRLNYYFDKICKGCIMQLEKKRCHQASSVTYFSLPDNEYTEIDS